ncbi:MAG: hypothetical protein KGQ36_00495 [Rickettsiales bacterium]|nr:hypothetical protein [Rickettsiales bacterium]
MIKKRRQETRTLNPEKEEDLKLIEQRKRQTERRTSLEHLRAPGRFHLEKYKLAVPFKRSLNKDLVDPLSESLENAINQTRASATKKITHGEPVPKEELRFKIIEEEPHKPLPSATVSEAISVSQKIERDSLGYRK